MLRDHKAPGPVATCEMAFVRTAIIRDAIKRCQPELIAEEMLAAVGKLTAESFAGEDTELTLKYCKNEQLSVIAPLTIRLYEENVFPLTHLADLFAHRLSVPGFPSVEIGPLFEQVATEAERAMKSVNIVSVRLG